MREKAALPTAFSRVEPVRRRSAVLAGHEQRELELAGPLVQCQQAPPVGFEPHHGVHLAGGGALLLGQTHERAERARLAVGRRLRPGGA